MPASIWRRMAVWKGPLYTSEEMFAQLAAALSHTLEEDDVVAAIQDIDSFDAGAVDEALHRKAMQVLKKLRLSDKVRDIKALNRAEKYLDLGKHRK